ncbi:MAG: hypothetical protein EPO10_00855 [Reyranella sp.]|uniref:hypothetical protein n=1 Tax=Reyranella sp. TaxID=1929291 RepID=UPI0011F94623|nr:hypothetical protein [Reyranella sp.]TAJ97369.1 MAG: hypothetical protein EPO41_02900 [Reyranella sp.]TBR30824.1 MAG: hypothetical protein EPO10_00855 [Reyranella sp.]
MPFDATHAELGFELASLRALGEGRRRRSLADRMLRERRDMSTDSDARVGRKMPQIPVVPPSRTEP